MNKKRIFLSTFLVLGLVGIGVSSAQQENPSGYHLIGKVLIGGGGGWDYMALSVRTRLLYVTHGDCVEIIDVDTGVKTASIPGFRGVHGVALAPDKGRGYISDGKGNGIAVFDLATGRVLDDIPSSGKDPDGILYDAFSGRVFAFNGLSSNATVIDASANRVVGTIDLGGKPEFPATDGRGMIFVNDQGTSEVLAIDAGSLTVRRRWSIAPGARPTGLAIDPANGRLFSVCNKVLVVSNFAKGKVVATVPIGRSPDAVRYDPETGLIFTSNGEGTLTIVRQETPDDYRVLDTIATAPGARTMELDPATHHVFLVTASFGPDSIATNEKPHPRPPIVPGTFILLEYGK
ncbi:MAG: hypothetical protein ACLQMF_09195 [Rectinemataceae bacterium]